MSKQWITPFLKPQNKWHQDVLHLPLFLLSYFVFYLNTVCSTFDRIMFALLFALLTFVTADPVNGSNNCITFSVGTGTGCQWMCNYCATNLGTNNYYFTDNVCTYETGVGCVGNPLAGKLYTCCSANKTEDKDDDEFILEDFCSF